MALPPNLMFGNFARCIMVHGVWYRMDVCGLMFAGQSAMLMMLNGYRRDPELNYDPSDPVALRTRVQR